MSKVLRVWRENGYIECRTEESFNFIAFTSEVVALGGFTDGKSVWVPVSAIHAITYNDPEVSLAEMQSVGQVRQ